MAHGFATSNPSYLLYENILRGDHFGSSIGYMVPWIVPIVLNTVGLTNIIPISRGPKESPIFRSVIQLQIPDESSSDLEILGYI